MKKNIAVLHAQIPFTKGGAEIMVNKLVEQLNIYGFSAELVSMPFRWYPENSFYDSMLMWNMLNLEELNGKKIDLVIGTKFPSYGIEHSNKVVWLMHQHRAAYDLHNNVTHGGMDTIANGKRMKEIVKRYDALHLKDAKKIYTISQNVGNRLKKYNQLDSEILYHPPGLEGRYKSGEYGDYIFTVGRLDPLKRMDYLIRAIAKSDKKIRVKIAGQGGELSNLQKLAQELNVLDRVDFLGFVNDDELLELYSNAFAVYYAPIDEDYGYVTLEAFLSTKPVITCNDSGGVLEFVRNDVNGFICDLNAESIAMAVNRLYEDKALCQEFGNNGYETIKSITWKNVVERLTATL